MRKLVVVANAEAAEVEQPGIRAFDDPAAAIAPELAPILIAVFVILPMRNDEVNAPVLQPLPELPTVVAAIGDDPDRLLLRATGPDAPHRYGRKRRFREVTLREIGGRKVHSERNTRAVDQYHELCPLTLACFADASAPFFAGANVPSRKASLQSSWPRASNSLRKARQRLSHTSCRSHSLSRRQQVAPLGYCGGTSRHRAPVRSTQRMPSKQSRFSARGRPPRTDGFIVGNNGAIFAHCVSVNNRRMSPSLHRVNLYTIQFGF